MEWLVDGRKLFPLLMLVVVLGVSLAVASDDCGETWDATPCALFAGLLFSSFVTIASVAATAGVAWGCPQVALCLIQVLGVASMAALLFLVFFLSTTNLYDLTTVVNGIATVALAFFVFNVRGWPLGLLGIALCSLATGIDANSVSNICLGVGFLAAAFTVHVKDQRIVLSLTLIHFTSTGVPFNYRQGSLGLVILACVQTSFMVYALVILCETQNGLPQELHSCKFLRLSYLRRMRRSGLPIKRLQEMPSEAFGNPTKAKYLLVTSHRWLNRYTCDVPDETHRHGVRLESMARRIGMIFPYTFSEADFGSQGFWQACRALFRSVIVAGDDVLIFFDFMGLPQIGMDAEGNQIPRTDDEASLFFAALPAMGSLYEMYPVVVIPEVTAETSSYFGSGWCYSEFCTSVLSGTLSSFSRDAQDAYTEWYNTPDANGCALSPSRLSQATTSCVDGRGAEEVLPTFLSDLEMKRFFNESDRSIVKGIIVGNFAKRQLLDAVQAQNVSAVRGNLRDMDRHDVLDALNHPIDPTNYDRLLHVAVRLPSVEIVRLLLEHGAEPRVKNYWGDLPWQNKRFPRCSAGSQLCKSWAQPESAFAYALAGQAV